MENFITADEARKRADSIKKAHAEYQMKAINELIIQAINQKNPDYQIQIYESLTPTVSSELKLKGYTIKETSNQKDGISVTISW